MNKNVLVAEICKLDSSQSAALLLERDVNELEEHLKKLKEDIEIKKDEEAQKKSESEKDKKYRCGNRFNDEDHAGIPYH